MSTNTECKRIEFKYQNYKRIPNKSNICCSSNAWIVRRTKLLVVVVQILFPPSERKMVWPHETRPPGTVYVIEDMQN